MTSRKSCSKGLVRDGMKRSLWALMLSVVGFFMAQLLPVLMTAQRGLTQHKQDLMNLSASGAANNWKVYVNDVASMLCGSNPFAKLVMIALAVVCGVSMFAYLHDRRKVDFYHSLPISRSRLFAVNFATGAACALVPYLVLHLLSAACACALGFGEAVGTSLIGVMAANVIFFLLLYALAALTTIICGSTIITLLLLLWVCFGATLVNVLRHVAMSIFFKTYASGVSSVELLLGNRLTPLLMYFGVNGTKYAGGMFYATVYNADGTFAKMAQSSVGLLVGYAVAAAVITALALVLFRIRRSERAGTALAFNPIKLPVKIIICAAMGVAFGELFYLLVDGQKLWFWIGLVLGTVLFHCVVEIIYAFDFRAIFRKPVQLLVILAVLCGVMAATQADVFGYDTWLPDEGSIEAAGPEYWSERFGDALLTEPENIAAARQLAVLGVQSLDDNTATDTSVIAFKMKNGSVKIRSYPLSASDEVTALKKQIYQSAEYKQKTWSLFSLGEIEQGYHREIHFYTNGDSYTCVGTLSDQSKVQEIIDTLKAETLTHTGDAKPVLRMEFSQQLNSTRDSDYYSEGAVCVTEKDVKTLALIKQYTGVVPKPFSAEEVNGVSLSIYLPEHDAYIYESVTDKADIAALLKNGVNIDGMNLYGSNSLTYGIIDRQDGVLVNFKNEDGDEWGAMLGYTSADYPQDIIEKYRLQAEKDYEDGIASQTAADTVEAG